jgi:hypothetical protein
MAFKTIKIYAIKTCVVDELGTIYAKYSRPY